MYLVYSESYWGHDGGCSTAMHSLSDTEDEAKKLVAELQESNVSTGENSPQYMHVYIPAGVHNLGFTNTFQGTERMETPEFSNLMRTWFIVYRSRLYWKSKKAQDKFEQLSTEDKLQVVIANNKEEDFRKWYEYNPELFTKILRKEIEECSI